MISLILVLLDGSKFAEQAIPRAVEIAQRTGARLQMVSVLEAIPPVVPVFAPPSVAAIPVSPRYLETRVPDMQMSQELREERERYLQQIASRVSADLGFPADAVLLEGAMIDAIMTHIRESGADLIVMTTHGRSGVSRLWLGSVAEDIVRHVDLPVLLEKPKEVVGDAEMVAHPFRHVLVPIDGTTFTEIILEPAYEIIGTHGVRYILLHIIEPLMAIAAANLAMEATMQMNEYLASLAERLRARGAQVETHTMTHAQVARALLQYADDVKTDVIAMATHPGREVRRFLLGSVTDKVLRGAPESVLLYQPPR